MSCTCRIYLKQPSGMMLTIDDCNWSSDQMRDALYHLAPRPPVIGLKNGVKMVIPPDNIAYVEFIE